MNNFVEYEIDWFVAFTDNDRFNIWDIFTQKGFRHCFAFRWDGYNWILIDPLGSWLEVQVMPYGENDNVPLEMQKLGHEVLYVRKSRENKFVIRGLLNCVTIIKHLLRIKAWWILTPKQLYNYTIRKNYGIHIRRQQRTSKDTRTD